MLEILLSMFRGLNMYKITLKGAGGPRPKIFLYAIFVEGKQSYQMLFTGSKNIDPSRIYCIFKIANYADNCTLSVTVASIKYTTVHIFTCDYLKILNFDTKNLSPPAVFELET